MNESELNLVELAKSELLKLNVAKPAESNEIHDYIPVRFVFESHKNRCRLTLDGRKANEFLSKGRPPDDAPPPLTVQLILLKFRETKFVIIFD